MRFGKPCVRGTRLTVGDFLGCLASGMTETKLLEDFPQITHDDVLACLAYAADRERLIGLGGADDLAIWDRARLDGDLLVTKDDDFLRLSMSRGFRRR